MFAKKFRLPAAVTLSQAQVFASPLFLLKITKNHLMYNRYGFVVTKKISKRAHIRNRTKRRFRVCVEKVHPTLLQGQDMLFVLKQAAVTEKTNVLCEEINKHLQKFLTIH